MLDLKLCGWLGNRETKGVAMLTLRNQAIYIDREWPDDYPLYSRNEKIFDCVTHIIGICGSLIAFSFLWSRLIIPPSLPQLWSATAVYTIAVIALFIFSAAYHMTPWPEYRPILRRFDQCAIFIKIAATYSPLVVLVGTPFSYTVLAVVWSVTLVGACFKLTTGDRLNRYTVVLYLALGWMSVLLLWPISQSLPWVATTLIILGGVSYSVGVIFHQWHALKFNNAIWHCFVLIGSLCHFGAISMSITQLS